MERDETEVVREKPNPGSPEAREQGCICPHYDNNGGRFAPRPPDGWVIVVGCPVHDGEEGEDGGA